MREGRCPRDLGAFVGDDLDKNGEALPLIPDSSEEKLVSTLGGSAVTTGSLIKFNGSMISKSRKLMM